MSVHKKVNLKTLPQNKGINVRSDSLFETKKKVITKEFKRLVGENSNLKGGNVFF